MSKDIGTSPSSLLGQAAVILACVFYAGSSIYIRKYTRRYACHFQKRGTLISATAVMWLATFAFESPVQIPATSHHMGCPALAGNPRLRLCLYYALLS